MRKNHHGKKDRLVKRVFALCLALAVICTCLVPVFATEGLIDPQVNQEASRPVDDGVASYPDDEVAGFGEPREVYDDSEAVGFGEEEATRPVEGGEDNLDGGPSVKETEWGTVIEYGPSSSTGTDSEPETQWSGEDDVVEKPDDKVVVSGDEIKKLQDMVVYRFWLKELNANDLQDITAQAQINNMTESEYLARNGEVLWNLYFIQAVPRAETIADYSSYIKNPSSNRDPKGELRLFDYWYTLDEFGNRVRLNLTDPTSNILDDKTTTVNVYAAWKDGTVGSDEEEDVDHEDLVDKNPVPVDLTAKASASYKDDDGNTKSVNLPVEVKNLPSAAHSLSVIHMGDDDMERFYESHEDSFGEMMPILGLKISPKNAKGETVQPAKGEKATVTVSGLDALPYMVKATAGELKVLHQTADGNVETLDVLSYQNGTLTFETSSFSPFVVAMKNQNVPDTMNLDATMTVKMDSAPFQLSGASNSSICGLAGTYTQKWTSSNPAVASVDQNGLVTLHATGTEDVIIYHTYCAGDSWYYGYYHNERTEQTKIHIDAGNGAWVYLYVQVTGSKEDLKDLAINAHNWFTIGRVWVSNLTDAESAVRSGNNPSGFVYQQYYKEGTTFDKIIAAVNGGAVERYESNRDVTLSDIVWNTPYGLKIDNGADDYVAAGTRAWHLDGAVSYTRLAGYTVNFLDADTGVKIRKSISGNATIGNTITAAEFYEKYRTITTEDDITYIYDKFDKEQITIVKGADNVINLYYVVPTSELSIAKTVTGAFGETGRNFKFALLVKSVSGSKLNSTAFKKYNSTGTEIENGTVVVSYETIGTNNYAKYEFELKHGEKIVFSSIPKGDYLIREDDYSGDKYTTSYVIGKGEGALKDTSNVASVTVGTDGAIVTFTNHRTLEPDLGVLLDTLPYIVILAVVAGGVALLMLRKRRKEDD